jgi:hypothetical protein
MENKFNDYLNLSKREQLNVIEDILLDLWESGQVELVGFDENNEPLFRVLTN